MAGNGLAKLFFMCETQFNIQSDLNTVGEMWDLWTVFDFFAICAYSSSVMIVKCCRY